MPNKMINISILIDFKLDKVNLQLLIYKKFDQNFPNIKLLFQNPSFLHCSLITNKRFGNGFSYSKKKLVSKDNFVKHKPISE